MAFFDLPLAELEEYKPARNEPVDFDSFWQNTLIETRAFSLDTSFQPVDVGLKTVDVFDVSFSGFQGQRVKGWFLKPRGTTKNLPCVVEYIGYGGGRSFPFNWLVWSSCGYAHFIMDSRGQGTEKRHGDTPDLETIPSNPQVPGFMTRGILSPNTYYYRRLFTDAVRAVEAARSAPDVDQERIAVTGRSQGGGVALAVAGLEPAIAIAMPDVPFLCNFRRAVEITNEVPYAEITQFCKTQRHNIKTAFHTLDYFDGMNFAVRGRAEAFFSVALMDETCPPSTVFSTYNHYAGVKHINVWEYNQHEGGESHQIQSQIEFLSSRWPMNID